jgi:hypothetical protein
LVKGVVLEVRGLHIGKYLPEGGGYQPMELFKNMKTTRENRLKCERNRKKGERKRGNGK